MTLWKHVERKIAELLGGKRIPITGRARGETPDVEHELFSIEVKHRENLPLWLKDAYEQAVESVEEDKIPIVILHEKYMKYTDSFVLITIENLIKILGDKNGDIEL